MFDHYNLCNPYIVQNSVLLPTIDVTRTEGITFVLSRLPNYQIIIRKLFLDVNLVKVPIILKMYFCLKCSWENTNRKVYLYDGHVLLQVFSVQIVDDFSHDLELCIKLEISQNDCLMYILIQRKTCPLKMVYFHHKFLLLIMLTSHVWSRLWQHSLIEDWWNAEYTEYRFHATRLFHAKPARVF